MLPASNLDAGSGGTAALVGKVAGLSGREKLHRRTPPKAFNAEDAEEAEVRKGRDLGIRNSDFRTFRRLLPQLVNSGSETSNDQFPSAYLCSLCFFLCVEMAPSAFRF